jgi:5-methylcytosine-specific restriction endonuclease McrA
MKISKIIKNRNSGTFSESQFWQFIRNSLRRRSIVWKPIYSTKEKAKRKYTGTNKRQKYEYQCNVCKNWFPGKDVAVDHITAVGSLTCADDLPGFVERLFCEEHGLQCICKPCHDAKTKDDIKNLK